MSRRRELMMSIVRKLGMKGPDSPDIQVRNVYIVQFRKNGKWMTLDPFNKIFPDISSAQSCRKDIKYEQLTRQEDLCDSDGKVYVRIVKGHVRDWEVL